MNKKIMAILIIGMFSLTSLAALSSVGKEVNILKTFSCGPNSSPRMREPVGVASVVYDKDGMTASFSAFGEDDDYDRFALYVSIHKEGSTPTEYNSASTNDWFKKLTVDIPLPAEDYPIGTKAYWSMWIQDEHGAESHHWDEDLVIRRSNSKSIDLFEMFFKNYPNALPLLRLLQNLIR
jgi:hypothetical protein